MPPQPVTQRLLVVEDDEQLRSQLRWMFEGCEVFIAGTRAQALEVVRQHGPQVVLQDLGLPPQAEGTTEGFACLAGILEIAPATKVIVVTGSHDRDRAVNAVALGAFDFFEKSGDPEVLRLIVQRAFHMARLEKEVSELRLRSAPDSFEGIVVTDRVMQGVCRTIEKVAPAGVSVLILGESGTGKELLARALHNLGGRAGHRFVAINCAAIPEQLLESELFGYERGAFTGATKTTPGKIESADGGTLFLDEIGDMPLPLQAKLLRFLQDRVVERVGGRQEIPVDTRVVAATNQGLEAMIDAGRFRQDLYFRLGEVVVKVPPLRERPGDILAIAQAFLQKYSAGRGRPRRGFTEEALQMLTAYNWPGNVRELESKVKVACLLGDEPYITAADLGLAPADASGLPLNLREIRGRAERDAISRALGAAGGNISRAAELLGVSRPTLYDLLSRHGMGPGAERRDPDGPVAAGGGQ